MARPLLPDDLWAVVQPLLPPEPPKPKGGRPRVPDRACPTGILFVLKSGIPWELLPREMGCGSGVTCRRRLRDWQAAGVWDRLHRELLRRLNARGRLDWSTGVVDGSHIRALRGGPLTGRSPVDRARAGSKHHLIVDCHGVPLAATLTGGHRNDVTQLLPLVDGIGAIAGKRGRPRRRPDRMIADRGYDHDKYRRELWRRGVKPVIARRGTEHGSGLGRVRWVVERTFAWLHNFRRLRIRWERNAGLHYAFLSLGCSLICWRHIRP
jgi:transposase